MIDVLCTDLDADGILDLYLVSPGADVALRGEGGGVFREATAELGLSESGPGRAAERLDVDGDGLLDLVVHNDGSEVLFWARADGRFEREVCTTDGAAPTATLPEVWTTLPGPNAPGADSNHASTQPAPTALASAPSARSGFVAAPPPTSTPISLSSLGLDARYVNDDMGEVGSADIVDGTLTGADVSTSSGNVTFGGGATLTARKAAFGISSTASGTYSAVLGGSGNTASGIRSTVSGGLENFALGVDSIVSGGGHNYATVNWATIPGGRYNIASGQYAFVAGSSSTASGHKSSIPGGFRNTAAGNYSFAAGRKAKANHLGSFVWGDSANVDKPSAAADEFNVYAEGGARIFAVGQATPSLVVDAAGDVGIGTATPGFTLEVNGLAHRVDNASTWTVTSDARLKKNVHDIAGALETMLSLRGVTFEYGDPAQPGLRRGFIAQEVEQVLPEWVEDGPDGYKRLTVNGFEALT
ncbi:MAG: tail fiber domain-containing protein, partial [Actinobacteria bacterium]|nr:tail fiber domain-containing protein [Actinomycetota bacterium]